MAFPTSRQGTEYRLPSKATRRFGGTTTLRVRLLPEHGPGAVARTTRQPHLQGVERVARPWNMPAVEVRDLAVYDACAQAGGLR